MRDPFGWARNQGVRLDEPEWGSDRVDNPRLWTPNLGYDVEFERAKTADPPPGWAWVNQSTNSTFQEWMGAGVFTQLQETENNRFIARPVPNFPQWEMYAKMAVAEFNTRFTGGALYLYDGTKLIKLNTVLDNNIEVNKYTNFTTFSASLYSNPMRHMNPMYLRIRKNSATSYDFMVSPDCLTWIELVAANDITTFLTPTHFGFGTWNANSGTCRVGFHWIRVRPLGQSFRQS